MVKRIHIPGYNMVFNNQTGFLARWGNTPDDDPVMCPIGPEIADIEISTICNGIGRDMDSRKPCAWCYKSNTGVGKNMSLETFKKVFKQFPPTLTQIAFGIGDIEANPDLWEIMAYCRAHGVVPNITINGMGLTDEAVRGLSLFCGAVAVSHYHVDDTCFDAVARLSKAGLKQINIHKLLSKETYKDCFRLIDEVKTNPKLAGLKAIVFLLLKPKGERNKLHSITSDQEYKELINYAGAKGVAIGMDSCSAPMVLRNVPTAAIPSIEPCESTLFSIYVNVDGEIFPCSFTEGTHGWEKGIDLTKVEDFHKEVWFSERLTTWRNGLLGSAVGCSSCAVQKHCRACPVYDVTPCKEKNENP